MTYAQEQLDHATAASPRQKAQSGIQEAILNAMHKRIGLHSTISEIQEEVAPKFDPPLERKQVANAAYQLSRKGLVRAVESGVYVYNPTDNTNSQPSVTGQMYETIGFLEDGTAVVRNEDGLLYVLHKLTAVGQ